MQHNKEQNIKTTGMIYDYKQQTQQQQWERNFDKKNNTHETTKN